MKTKTRVRDAATGRVIARAHLNGTTVSSLEVLIAEKDASGQAKQGTWSVRPVDVRQGPDDAVYVSDDSGGRVLKTCSGAGHKSGDDERDGA